MRSHFTQDSYDFFKYNKKVNVRADTFEKRNDKYQFQKLGKHQNPEEYMLANYIDGDVSWVGDLSPQIYSEWKKRQESLTYLFKGDLKKLLPSFDDNVKVTDHQHPPLLKNYLRKEIMPETLIVLAEMMPFFRSWNKKIEDGVVWPRIYTKCIKYRPFLLPRLDMPKMKQIVLDTFDA